jgi:hypothetical protein
MPIEPSIRRPPGDVAAFESSQGSISPAADSPSARESPGPPSVDPDPAVALDRHHQGPLRHRPTRRISATVQQR